MSQVHSEWPRDAEVPERTIEQVAADLCEGAGICFDDDQADGVATGLESGPAPQPIAKESPRCIDCGRESVSRLCNSCFVVVKL